MESTPPSGAGAPISPAELLNAYREGRYPMVDAETGRLDWFSPPVRGILPLDGFHVPRNVSKLVRQRRFEISADRAFERVVRSCARKRSADNLSWIDERLVHGYLALHAIRHAHSIEAWVGDRLVGGLFGVHVGAAFFGESMFSRADQGGTDSSKVCLVHLVNWLRCRGFTLLDVQEAKPHLKQFGCIGVARRRYLALLSDALQQEADWGVFESDAGAPPHGAVSRR